MLLDTIRDRDVVRASLSTSSGIDGSRYEVRAILDRWVRIKYMHFFTFLLNYFFNDRYTSMHMGGSKRQ